MGLVKCVDGLNSVFGSSGLLKTEPVRIALKEDAQPYAVHTDRWIPLPLVPLVKKELQRLNEKVTQLQWCKCSKPTR